MPNLGTIHRSLRRHGVASARIILDRIICQTGLGSHKTIAKAASRIYRWKLANEHWDKVRVDLLDSAGLTQMATSLLRNRRWQDAANVVTFAEAIGRSNLQLELARTEALWYLKDLDGVERSRERAIGYLKNPTRAEISLIRNQNQVAGIYSRLALLQATEPQLQKIKHAAKQLEAIGSADKAFVFWNSGLDKAPAIVRVCVQQMHETYGDDLVQLDAKTIDKWLPAEHVLKRVAKLWPANYSDAIRVGLIARHGGVWLDSTILTSENATATSKNHDLLVYRYNGPRIASWFMQGRAGSYQARMLYAAMLEYWSRNRKLKNYFLFHDLFEVLYHLDDEFKQAFDDEPDIDARPSLAIHRTLWKPFDQAAFTSMLASRPVQKLTYKPGSRQHGSGTTYEWLEKQA